MHDIDVRITPGMTALGMVTYPEADGDRYVVEFLRSKPMKQTIMHEVMHIVLHSIGFNSANVGSAYTETRFSEEDLANFVGFNFSTIESTFINVQQKLELINKTTPA